MENMATSVRISADANALLAELAGKTGKPKAQIIREALRDWEDRIFWTEVQAAFAALHEPDELGAETDLWESTVGDGLKNEAR
jgi:predicted transcriptional regulator